MLCVLTWVLLDLGFWGFVWRVLDIMDSLLRPWHFGFCGFGIIRVLGVLPVSVFWARASCIVFGFTLYFVVYAVAGFGWFVFWFLGCHFAYIAVLVLCWGVFGY